MTEDLGTHESCVDIWSVVGRRYSILTPQIYNPKSPSLIQTRPCNTGSDGGRGPWITSLKKIVFVWPRDECFCKFYLYLSQGQKVLFIYYRYIKIILNINLPLCPSQLPNSKLSQIFSPDILVSLDYIEDHKQGED